MEENMENNQEVDTEVEELEEEVKTEQEEIKYLQLTEEEMQAEINKAVEGRLARERRNNKDLFQIENTLKTGLGVETREDLLNELNNFYKEKGIEVSNTRDEYEEKLLGKAEAEELVKISNYQELETEANRIASIPEAKRSIREKESFNIICENLMQEKRKKEFKEKGYDQDLLQDNKFIELESKFKNDTNISEVVEMYQKLYGEKKKPASPGSAKDKSTTDAVRDFYTFEESKKFTREDYDKNPKLFQAVKRSMSKWK